jgi:hypothetical protein
MQKVAKAAREYQVDKWGGRRITTGEVAYDDHDHVMRETKQQATAQDWFDRNAPKSAAVMRATKQQATAHADKWEQYVQPIPGDQQPSGKSAPQSASTQAGTGGVKTDPWEEAAKENEREDPGAVSINLQGITRVTVDKDGLVSSIDLSTGESLQRVGPPALKAYFIPLLYPILGFLLPWGCIRVFTWVGSGFVAPRP